MIRRHFLASILSAFVALARTALVAQTHAPLTDAQIREFVEHKLWEENDLKGGVSVSVARRTVTLRGRVPSVWAKGKAAELTFEVPDVEAVEVELDVA